MSLPAAFAGSFAILAGLLALGGCDDAPNESGYKVVSAKQPLELQKWLTVQDAIEPSVWLRSREVGREVLPSDPEVDRLRRAIHQASVRFFEDPRMIANRTAQTGDMLAEAEQPERYVDIITGMVDVADTTAAKKLFGEMCQHYLNMRKTGLDRTAALANLIASYKTGEDPR